MLDSERFRILNIAVFTCMGSVTALMVMRPTELDIPVRGFESDELNSTLRRMLVIAYYFVIFSPIIMGIPRQSFHKFPVK